MQIDPLKQMATVQIAAGNPGAEEGRLRLQQDRSRAPAQALRGRRHLQATPTTRPIQAYENSKADYESTVALTDTQKQQLAYYHIRAPFAGIVGDIPVHLGDYVSPTTRPHHGGRKRGPRSLHLHPHRARHAGPHGPARRDPRHRRQRARQVNRQLPLAAGRQRPAEHPRQGRDPAHRAASPQPAARQGPRHLEHRTAPDGSRARGQPRRRPDLRLRRSAQGRRIHRPPGRRHRWATPSATSTRSLGGLKPGDKVIISGLQFLQEGAPVKPLG